MKRKLIQITQDFLIICDNPVCDYTVENPTKDPNIDVAEYINAPCPICGENLLTGEDYLMGMRVMNAINWINKWFGWLAYVIPGKKEKSSIHVHNGVHFKENHHQTK